MYYTKEDIAKLLTLSIESVALALGLLVERHCCPCPSHPDSNPSMHFYASTNRFFCFSCRKGGNVIDLVKLVLGVGFIDACNWLVAYSNDASIYGQHNSCNQCDSCSEKEFNASKYERYFEHPYLNKPACDFLFLQRKLHPTVIGQCRLSSWKNWLQIPYFDLDGRLIDVQFRNLGSSGPRFKFPSGSHASLYNLPVLKTLSPGEELFIAEGCSDCWSLLSSGHKAIAIPSATTFGNQMLEELSIINSQLSIRWSMYPDADEPGEQLYQRLCKSLPVIRHSLPYGCKDFSNLYLKNLCY